MKYFKAALFAAVFALSFSVSWLLSREWRRYPGEVILGLDAGQVRRLCLEENYPLLDFWERARAIGVRLILIGPESLQSAIDSAGALYFSDADVAKWKAVGIISPFTSLEGGALWVKDDRLWESISKAAEKADLITAQGTVAGHHFLRFSRPFDFKTLALRADPETLRLAQALDLTPAYKWPLLVEASANSQAMLVFVDAKNMPEIQARFPPGETALSESRLWWLTNAATDAEWPQKFRRRTLSSSLSHVAPISADLGVEGNLSRLREAAVGLARRGKTPALKPLELIERYADFRYSSESSHLRLRKFSAALLIFMAPFLALKAGLSVLYKFKRSERWLLAAPVWQLSAAYLAATGAAAALGLAAHALLSLPEFWWGQWKAPSLLWAAGAPVAIFALRLLSSQFDAVVRLLRGPVDFGHLFYAGLFASLFSLVASGGYWAGGAALWIVFWIHHHAKDIVRLTVEPESDSPEKAGPGLWALLGICALAAEAASFCDAAAPFWVLARHALRQIILGGACGIAAAAVYHWGGKLKKRVAAAVN